MPKRSSGCDLCRKRKVRCDETRPKCQRCANFGANCPGYTRTESVVFRDQTTTTASKANTRRLIKQKTQDSILNSPPAWVASEHANSTLTPPRSVSPVEVNGAPERRAMLLAKFFETYLPMGGRGSEGSTSQYSYLLELPRSNANNLAFATAVDALTVVHLGTQYADQRLLHESRLIYGKALAYLYRALLHPKLQAQDETLATVALLGLCDFFRGTSQDGAGWLSHATGAKGILKYRGPTSIQSPLAMKLYLNQRYTSILGGMLARRKVFFDDPDWLKLTADSSGYNEWTTITDIMVKIPALLEDSDRVCDDTSQPAASQEIPVEKFAILERYTMLQRRLQIWYQQLTSSLAGDICESVDVTTMTEFWKLVPDMAFPTVLSFPSYTLAYLYALYSLASYVICKNAADVRSTLPTHLLLSPPMTANQSIPSLTVLRRFAHAHIISLAQSVPYLCTSPSGSVGRIQSLAFLWFVQDYFRRQSQGPEASPLDGARSSHESETPSQPQWRWTRRIYSALAKYGIIPPRISIPVNDKGVRKYVMATTTEAYDDVHATVGRVVEDLGAGTKSVDLTDDTESRIGIEVSEDSADPSPIYREMRQSKQGAWPSPAFLKAQAASANDGWQRDRMDEVRAEMRRKSQPNHGSHGSNSFTG